MKLTLKEMNGLLNGKCLPSDLIVGETLAEYLVRKFTELEKNLADSQREFRAADATIENLQMQLEKLAAENAGLKALARGWANATDDRLFEEHGEIFHDSIDACEEELKTICPATDAFLAEVRAQGVEMFARTLRGEAEISKACTFKPVQQFEDFACRADEFAAKLRKGVQS